MPLLTVAAIFFILWWTVLFVVLPLGYRSQKEETGTVALGTVESAPVRFRGLRVIVLTTLISIALYAAYYVLSSWLGIGIATLPDIMPTFE